MTRGAGVCALAVAAVLAFTVNASAATIAVDVTARAIAPGELLLLTIKLDEPATSVKVTAFRKSMPAFKVDEHTWRVLVGVDLDVRPGRYTAAVEADVGPTLLHGSKVLVVVPHEFPKRALQVDPDFVNPPPAQMTRINDDSAFLRKVYASSAAVRLWSAPFVRPVPQEANSRFGSRSVYNGEPRSPHAGADFLSPAGTPIKAPNAGRVVCARDLYFTGNTVIIDHGLGVFSLLAHLSRIDVHEGDIVTPAQVVGLVGATGRVTGPHLHWGFQVSGARVDPLSVLAVLGH